MKNKTKLAATAVALMMASCVQAPSASGQSDPSVSGQWEAVGSKVQRIYDREYGVVCYVMDGYQSGGIACLNVGVGAQ